jgi:hypothetical protein
MDAEDSARVIKTKELIEVTRGEIMRMRAEVRNARETIEHSLKLLARSRPDRPVFPRKLGSAL